jgi:hypothetical protein
MLKEAVVLKERDLEMLKSNCFEGVRLSAAEGIVSKQMG